jgi:hypothetical protein
MVGKVAGRVVGEVSGEVEGEVVGEVVGSGGGLTKRLQMRTTTPCPLMNNRSAYSKTKERQFQNMR